ncbi:MAG: MoxR-like ATPase, regulator [Bacteroidota bacterium]|jgi:MoxR-like ATPase
MSEEISNPGSPSGEVQSEWMIGLNPTHRVDVKPISEIMDRVHAEIGKVIIGQDNLIEKMMVALLTGGHVLIEGLPGIAKTLTAKLMAQTINAEFSRIQFTPDLMPTDVTGTSVFNMKESTFNFRKGPIFANIVLIDEINRAPAKTQAALMEVMEERQVTYDGETYKMDFPFFVIATQNPVEQEGTYSLPEAQLDRFIFRIKVPYPTLQEEREILIRFENDFDVKEKTSVNQVTGPKDLSQFRELIQKIYIRPELLGYIAALVNNTRNNGDIFLGASPRASLGIMKASKALAAIRGREFVTPDDIRDVSVDVLNHRVVLSHEREMEGVTLDEIIKGILTSVEIPR